MAIISEIKSKVIQEYASFLASEGKSLIEAAYYGRDFNNRTYNLHDSYGSCVFYNGAEIPNTRRYIGQAARERVKGDNDQWVSGREEIDKYFNSYKSNFKGFELVTAVAIYYGKFLERGGGRLRRKYKVISGMDGELAELARKLNAKIVSINI